MNVYSENGIITKIQDFIEHPTWTYPLKKLNNYNLHLYKHSYIGFDLICLGNQELNEESFNFVKKYDVAIRILNVVVMLINLMWIFVGPGSVDVARKEAYKGKDLFTCASLICIDFPISIPLLSVSFGLSLASINPIFKCTNDLITEKIIQAKNFEIMLTEISFGLYMFMIVINLIIVIIANDYLGCYKKEKENKEETTPKLL